MHLDAELQEQVKYFLEYLRIQKNYSPNTSEAYHNDINHFFAFLHKYNGKIVDMASLAETDIRIIRSWLSERHQNDYCASSNGRALSALKKFYRYLEHKKGLKCHALYLVKTPKKPKLLPKAIDKNQAETLLDEPNIFGEVDWLYLRNKALLTLIYASGLRISEALSLTKRHLENQQFIKILGKGQKERVIPWVKASYELIELYLKSLPYHIEIDEPIFRGEKGGPLSRTTFSKELVKLRRAIGLPESFSSHALRHSFATHLLENGANLKSIQDLLGHKSLSTTQCYTKINQSHLKDVYNRAHPEAKK